MKIGVIGAGVSGIIFAINRKMKHPLDEVIVFEHLDKPLKKILSTGDGKCNIGNKNPFKESGKNAIVATILNEYGYDKQKEFLNSLNIKTKLINDLEYPISESAITVRNLLLQSAEENKVKILLEVNTLGYEIIEDGVVLETDKGKFIFDKLVFATGGKSSPKLGSDGSIFPILKKHEYVLDNLIPALCPIKTIEKTKVLDGTRVKAVVTLLCDKKQTFKEEGELLFKEHGLSGIVIFNASRVIAKNIYKLNELKIDLLPYISEKELNIFLKEKGRNVLLDSYLHPNLVKYIKELKIKNEQLVATLKALPFTFQEMYGFEYSQISVGGIDFEDLSPLLESLKEEGIYFLGELLDYDAPCGGHNLMWAIGTALYLSDKMA